MAHPVDYRVGNSHMASLGSAWSLYCGNTFVLVPVYYTWDGLL